MIILIHKLTLLSSVYNKIKGQTRCESHYALNNYYFNEHCCIHTLH